MVGHETSRTRSGGGRGVPPQKAGEKVATKSRDADRPTRFSDDGGKEPSNKGQLDRARVRKLAKAVGSELQS